MARKTKEIINDDEVLKKPTAKPVKKVKSTTKSKKVKTEESLKVAKTDESSSKSIASKTTKKPTTKKKSTAKKSTTKKRNSKTSIAKKVSTKKVTSKKAEVFTPEYYDLPYRYNQTVVKILAQTPSSLFIYWDISDDDRNHIKETYGEHVFEITKPVLIIHNLTKNYSFEVDINDFANSWYLHVSDSNCEYDIELGRRPIPINYAYINNYNEESNIAPVNVPYIYVSSSNNIEAPNDKILFNNNQKIIYFRNVKTNEIIAKDASSLVFVSNIGRFFGLSELYNKFFREDEIIRNDYILNNPSSGNPSSNGLSNFK